MAQYPLESALLTIISLLFASLTVMLAAYMRVRKHLNSPHPLLEGETRKTVEQNVKLSKTLFVTIGLSFFFWFPTIIIYTILAFCLNCANLYFIWLVTILSLANSVVNPFVYCYKMPAFKAAIKRLFRQNRSFPTEQIFSVRTDHNRALQLVEPWAVTREVVSSTPVGPTLTVLK